MTGGSWPIPPCPDTRISGGLGDGLACPVPFPHRSPMVGLHRDAKVSSRRCRLSPPPPQRDAALPGGPAAPGDLPRRGAGSRPHGLGHPVVGGARLPKLPPVRHPGARVRTAAMLGLRARPTPGVLLQGTGRVPVLQRPTHGGGGGPPDRRGDPAPPRPAVGAFRAEAATALPAPDARGGELGARRLPQGAQSRAP